MRLCALHCAEQLRPRHVRAPEYLVVDQSLVYVFHTTARKLGVNKVHKVFEHHCRGFLILAVFHLGHECVALPELGLQLLDATQALKLTVYHDSDAGAQRLTFLHAGRVTPRGRYDRNDNMHAL